MAGANNEYSSLRFGRREGVRLIVAVGLSLLLHLGIWGGYHLGHKLGWWQKLKAPAWLTQEKEREKLLAEIAQAKAKEAQPTVYVDVSHADADAPKETQYYSDKNTHAANPDTGNSNVPKITGTQTVMAKTEDVAKPAPKSTAATPADAQKKEDSPQQETPQQLNKLQPAVHHQPTPTQAPETPPAPQTPGDLDPPVKPTPSTPESTRPRTIRQALAQQQLAGRQMHQDGGVQRHALTSSLDVKATPFGEYDGAIIEAVQQRWYDLLDNRRFADDRTGKVTLRFKLMSDGRVLEVQTVENTVGDVLGYLCQDAIEEAAPFAKWPPDMMHMIGANYREITFTFYYY